MYHPPLRSQVFSTMFVSICEGEASLGNDRKSHNAEIQTSIATTVEASRSATFAVLYSGVGSSL